MAHVRSQIRSAFKARLAGIRGIRKVVGMRAHALADTELPALQVITPEEAVEPLDSSDIETMRRVTVDVIAFALGNDGDDDTIDAISAQVETLIGTASGGIWDRLALCFPVSADLGIGGPAEQTLVMLRTRFRVQFSAANPETIGDG